MILLMIAIGMAVIFAVIRPFNTGWLHTGKWLVKISMHKFTEPNLETLKKEAEYEVDVQGQRVIYFTISMFIFLFVAIVLSFIFHWWAVFIIAAIAILLGKAIGYYFTPSLYYYVKLTHKRILNEINTIKASDDKDELEKYEGYLATIEAVIPIYKDSKLKPPTGDEIDEMPYGDINYFIENYELVK